MFRNRLIIFPAVALLVMLFFGSVSAKSAQNYAATSILTISGNAGVAGALLTYYLDGTLPTTTTADGSGNYSLQVPYNWSGTVTPSLASYTFTPASRSYINVIANQSAQNYAATPTPTSTPTPTEIPDGTLPTIDSFSINAGALSSTSIDVTLIISASDPTNGVDQMSFSNDGTTWSTWQAYTTSASWSLLTGDGSKTVYARVRDITSNISSPVSDTISLDTTVGTEFAMTINNGALFTNHTAVTLTVSARPSTAQMQVSNDGGFTGITWEPYASQKTWTITQFGSYVIPRVVYVRYKDINGNISATFQDDIILDVTPPEGGFSIIAGTSSTIKEESLGISMAVPMYGDGLAENRRFHMWLLSRRFPNNLNRLNESFEILHRTVSLEQTYTIYLPLVVKGCSGCINVTLLLSASDDVSGVGQVMISNQSDFAGAQWQPYTTQKDWSVSGTGTTTVYVKFRDNAGNVSIVYSRTFSP